MKLRSYIGSRFWGRTFAEGSLRTWMHEEVVREYIRHGLFAAAGALVYVDEYVGPSRGEWSMSRIQEADALFAGLPASVKRSRHLKLPVDWRDPTEAVRSSEIPAALARHFEILECHDYGGNFLSVIHPHLRLDHLTTPERAGLLQSIIDAECEHLAAGHRSYYVVALARATPPLDAA
ncbi:MAG: hypothetical protein ACJ76J_22090 [Thermoanaerobaculia bacterium]